MKVKITFRQSQIIAKPVGFVVGVSSVICVYGIINGWFGGWVGIASAALIMTTDIFREVPENEPT